MQTKYFSPSINIKRDQNQSIHYIPTQNSERAFKKITAAFEHGSKSFNIIGAYGSGKSSFILALEKVLNNKESYFINPFNESFQSFETTFIIGEYSSFKDVFCETFEIHSTNNPFDQLKEKLSQYANSKIGQLIVVDEFGKFLEYAAKESPEDELYFIQQLAEFANTPDLPVIFITTLHQPFEDYALALNKSQKNEWDKVKGRLIEISFNEPVEQLLFLASERIKQKNYANLIPTDKQRKLFEGIQMADVFPMKDYFSFDFAKKLFPFDILSASIATIAFQRYGQNERSLFTFLESKDYHGINDFTNGDKFFHIPHLYYYLKYNFHTLLNSRFNPDSAKWRALDEALQRVESNFDENYNIASEILITITLSSILGRQGQKITKEFLNIYSQVALGIENSEAIIEQLEAKKIIRYRNYSQSYVLFKGTDFDINAELEISEDHISKDFSIVHHLQKQFNFPIIPAKRIYYELGTPRYFVYELTENIIEKSPEGSIDGYINLIFNSLIDTSKVINQTSKKNQAILYGCYQNNEQLKQLLVEIEKIKLTKSRCIDDLIATSELEDYYEAVQNKLNQVFQSSFFGEDAKVNWIFNGKEIYFANAREMNSFLSNICETIYPDTPRLLNELMNREKLSGTISSAKNFLIQKLLENQHLEDLNFESGKFPPEKSIYLALLKNTGIHKVENGIWKLGYPLEKSFQALWKASEEFLDDCAISSRKLNEFIAIFKQKPFKLKQGFIEFWIPIFLIAKQKHFAFYEGDLFIPQLTFDTIEVAMKQAQKYRINTFNLDQNRLRIFNRYRYFLNLIENNAPDSDTFIETVKPFIGFYNRLQPYTKQTRSISEQAQRLREAISHAKDPEKIFFEDIPSALGFILKDFENDAKIEDFTIALQSATREISAALSNLTNRLEKIINKATKDEKLVFPENKILLQKRYAKLKTERIKTNLKALYQRIVSPLDDRQSWISSIAFVIVGKSIDQFTDEDEKDFKSSLPRRLHELDNLTEISQKDIDKENEEVLKLEITSFVDGVQNNMVRLSKQKSKEIAKLEEKIRPFLKTSDKQANIALLIKLLQKEIRDEQES